MPVPVTELSSRRTSAAGRGGGRWGKVWSTGRISPFLSISEHHVWEQRERERELCIVAVVFGGMPCGIAAVRSSRNADRASL